MTLGEMRQLASYDALGFSERDYFALNRAKTASLLGAACEVGALCGAPRHRAALRRYGEQLGMAFQLADDLLDYTETRERHGQAERHRPARAQGDAAADRGAAARCPRPAARDRRRAVRERRARRRADRGSRADRHGLRRARLRAPEGRGVRRTRPRRRWRGCQPARRASRWRTPSPTSWTGGRNHGAQGIVQDIGRGIMR